MWQIARHDQQISAHTTVRARGKTNRFANQKRRPATGMTQMKDRAAKDIAAMPRATAVARKAAISGPAAHARCLAQLEVVHLYQSVTHVQDLQHLISDCFQCDS